MKNPIVRAVAVASVTAVAMLGTVGPAFAAAKTTGAASAGGHLNVVVVASQWPGLDPTTNTQDAADSPYQNAIYGQLFELNAKNQITPNEASSYHFSNHNATVSFTIRKGLVFSNGDPVTAADVAWSINRDLEPKYGNIGDVNFPLACPVTASGDTVTMNLKHGDVAILEAFINEAPNWTVDEKALNSLGEAKYAQLPIGAGPFTVVSNTASASLSLTVNKKYWQYPQKPYVSGITFTNIGNDQSAVAALQAGQDELALGVSTIPVIKALPADGLIVYKLPAITTEFIAMNTLRGPFTNILARQAVGYATNSAALVKGLYGGEFTTVQSQTGPGQLFYQQTNKDYDNYNLAKAKALVKQLGGLSVSLCTTFNNAYFINEVQAIATMWEAAGIKVHIQDYTLQQMLNITFNGSWQAIDENWGTSVDPSINLPQFFQSGAAFSGVKNPTLDSLFNQLASDSNPTQRAQITTKIANLENEEEYGVFMYAKNFFDVSTKGFHPNGGITNALAVEWEDVQL